MITEWKAVLSANALRWNLPPQGRWKFLIHNNYQPNQSGVNIFWFCGKTTYPQVVTKIFPESSLANQEFQNLSDAHGYAQDAVPKPLGLFERHQAWALWMSGVPGSPLTLESLSDSLIDGLCDTLVRIQKGIGHSRPAHADRYRDCFLAPLEYASNRTDAFAQPCRRTLATFSNDRLNVIPTFPQHGDLYCGNLITDDREKCSIVDWELFGKIDLPFYDVMRFLSSLDSENPPDRWSPTVQRYARRLISRYASVLRLGRDDFTSLLPVLLANWYYRQPLPKGKAFAQAALANYFARTSEWEQALFPCN